MGVAGTVEDLDGNPLKGYPIHIWGGGLDVVVNSGDDQMYGDSGWEQLFPGSPYCRQWCFPGTDSLKGQPESPAYFRRNHPEFPGILLAIFSPGHAD